MAEDSRQVRKTKAALYSALLELLREKRYAAITIQDIIDRADIGRTTFYAHFQAKDDLLSECVEMIFESLNKPFGVTESSSSSSSPIPAAALLMHIEENKKVIKGIMLSEGGEIFLDRFKEYWGVQIDSYFDRVFGRSAKTAIPRDVVINHVSGSFIELVRLWLKDDCPYSPQEMEDYYCQLVLPSLASVFGVEKI